MRSSPYVAGIRTLRAVDVAHAVATAAADRRMSVCGAPVTAVTDQDWHRVSGKLRCPSCRQIIGT